MKLKSFALFLLLLLFNTEALAKIEMVRNQKYGFDEPIYIEEGEKIDGNNVTLMTYSDFFPIHSIKQGSIFFDILKSSRLPIEIKNMSDNEKTNEQYLNILKKGTVKINELTTLYGYFGAFHESDQYAAVKYIYPAFFDNNIYIITSPANKINVQKRNDLINYKGVYLEQEKFSKYVQKDFDKFGLQKIKDYEKAFEQLLTGKIDYIAASYYPSLIAAYSLGIRNYITYSQEPAWKMPMFIIVSNKMAKSNLVTRLAQFLKSSYYKTERDKALENLVNIYKEQAKGVVPPTYINKIEQKTTQSTENIPDSKENEKNTTSETIEKQVLEK